MKAKTEEFNAQLQFKTKAFQLLRNSTCISNYEEKLFLFKLLGNKLFVTTLLFRGSIHGWNANDFHSRCDGKGPTISLFKVKDGDCIGGYTNV
jgi:hypothetical protein